MANSEMIEEADSWLKVEATVLLSDTTVGVSSDSETPEEDNVLELGTVAVSETAVDENDKLRTSIDPVVANEDVNELAVVTDTTSELVMEPRMSIEEIPELVAEPDAELEPVADCEIATEVDDWLEAVLASVLTIELLSRLDADVDSTLTSVVDPRMLMDTDDDSWLIADDAASVLIESVGFVVDDVVCCTIDVEAAVSAVNDDPRIESVLVAKAEVTSEAELIVEAGVVSRMLGELEACSATIVTLEFWELSMELDPDREVALDSAKVAEPSSESGPEGEPDTVVEAEPNTVTEVASVIVDDVVSEMVNEPELDILTELMSEDPVGVGLRSVVEVVPGVARDESELVTDVEPEIVVKREPRPVMTSEVAIETESELAATVLDVTWIDERSELAIGVELGLATEESESVIEVESMLTVLLAPMVELLGVVANASIETEAEVVTVLVSVGDALEFDAIGSMERDSEIVMVLESAVSALEPASMVITIELEIVVNVTVFEPAEIVTELSAVPAVDAVLDIVAELSTAPDTEDSETVVELITDAAVIVKSELTLELEPDVPRSELVSVMLESELDAAVVEAEDIAVDSRELEPELVLELDPLRLVLDVESMSDPRPVMLAVEFGCKLAVEIGSSEAVVMLAAELDICVLPVRLTLKTLAPEVRSVVAALMLTSVTLDVGLDSVVLKSKLDSVITEPEPVMIVLEPESVIRALEVESVATMLVTEPSAVISKSGSSLRVVDSSVVLESKLEVVILADRLRSVMLEFKPESVVLAGTLDSDIFADALTSDALVDALRAEVAALISELVRTVELESGREVDSAAAEIPAELSSVIVGNIESGLIEELDAIMAVELRAGVEAEPDCSTDIESVAIPLESVSVEVTTELDCELGSTVADEVMPRVVGAVEFERASELESVIASGDKVMASPVVEADVIATLEIEDTTVVDSMLVSDSEPGRTVEFVPMVFAVEEVSKTTIDAESKGCADEELTAAVDVSEADRLRSTIIVESETVMTLELESTVTIELVTATEDKLESAMVDELSPSIVTEVIPSNVAEDVPDELKATVLTDTTSEVAAIELVFTVGTEVDPTAESPLVPNSTLDEESIMTTVMKPDRGVVLIVEALEVDCVGVIDVESDAVVELLVIAAVSAETVPIAVEDEFAMDPATDTPIDIESIDTSEFEAADVVVMFPEVAIDVESDTLAAEVRFAMATELEFAGVSTELDPESVCKLDSIDSIEVEFEDSVDVAFARMIDTESASAVNEKPPGATDVEFKGTLETEAVSATEVEVESSSYHHISTLLRGSRDMFRVQK
ncbi:hypothetical protein T440DRAFT_550219 [Plenodomus tracheiphilus IPT5]|uniref:Uncharacterized protein n=1 Tax=Plenodomus tracheiphilus IPT5 TaxID=1408161 RepID=A0A6A7BNY6_9PLEO|nr:hypothetical protein T440DRAFT_550219 [Plenodomus tracheiphilus IPT5]